MAAMVSSVLQPVVRKQRGRNRLTAVVSLSLLALIAAFFSVPSLDQLRLSAHLHKSQLTNLPARYIICSPSAHSSLRLSSEETSKAIYTGEDDDHKDSNGFASCVAVSDGLIRGVGSEQDVASRNCHSDSKSRSNKGPRSYKAARIARKRGGQHSNCDIRRLRPGQTLYPGFQDAHGHVLDYGWSRSVVDLVGANSVQEIVRRLENYVAAHPEFQAAQSKAGKVVWLEGLGWDQTRWDPPLFPTATDLSQSPVLRHLPIALRRIDVHALWLSEKALELVLEKASGFPADEDEDHRVQGGLVLRDEHGKPTGVLIDKAMNLAYQVIPEWNDAQRGAFLKSAAQGLLEAGITAIGDAATDLKAVSFYQNLDSKGQLPLRIYSMLACPPSEPRCADRVKQVRPLHSTGPGSRFTLRAVKLFNDGALGSWGSAMWEDYSDRPDERGLLLIDEDELKPLVSYWMDRDWQVCTHAIGDKANTLSLDAYEAFGSAKLRPRVEHAQLIRRADIERFSQLGVIASMQPTHCTSDMDYVETRIGPERAATGAYVWKSLLTHGASLALGSDFPVELPNPLYGMYSAITRLNASENSPHGPEGWYTNERLTRREALKGFTSDVSYAQFEESRSGSIAIGKRADFTLLDRDILDAQKVMPLMLRDARVDATFIDGQVVYDRVANAFADSRTLPHISVLVKDPSAILQQTINRITDFGHTFELGLLTGFLSSLLLVAFLLGTGGGEHYERLSCLALNTQRPKKAWMNMGHWTDQLHLPDAELDLPRACQTLAELLYKEAGVREGSKILDVGCGSGESVILLQERYKPSVLHAVTSLEAEARFAATRIPPNAKIWAEEINDWLERTEADGDSYDFVLALDCAYHFASRRDFIRMASRRLRPGGVIAFVDLLSSWPHSQGNKGNPAWPTAPPTWAAQLRHRINCFALSVPVHRLWSEPLYVDELVQAGNFGPDSIQIRDLTRDVLPGFSRFLRHFSTGHESWRGGNALMRFTLGEFSDITTRWGKGGNGGLVRCCLVIAKKGVSVDTQ